MADYDSNMIKPVDSLQNIIGLAPTRRREQRRRREHTDSEKDEHENKQYEELNQEDIKDDQNNNLKQSDDCGDSMIDYCA